MLLADVRRSELAIARALGLRSSDARAFFVQEGLVLSVIAGGLGSLLGLGLAWVISVGFSSIFASVGAQSFRFDWTLDSFLSGWIWGSLLAIGLLWATAFWNAQLNIVKALRGGRLVLSKGGLIDPDYWFRRTRLVSWRPLCNWYFKWIVLRRICPQWGVYIAHFCSPSDVATSSMALISAKMGAMESTWSKKYPRGSGKFLACMDITLGAD